MKTKEYIGILLGGVYGLVYRFLFETEDFRLYDFDVFSLSFLWVLPIAIGLIPILISNEAVLKSKRKQVFYPIASVILFFIMALITGLEDLVCLLILILPFIVVAGISGLIFSLILKNKQSDKLYSIILLPFLMMSIESKFANQKDHYRVTSSIIVEASKEAIWQNIVAVPEIVASEYDYGFYNYIGIPRPVKAELKEIDGTQYRIGHFTNNLKLVEEIVEMDTLNYVAFEIKLEQSTLRDLPTDKHILQSDYFKFDRIAYRLLKKQDETIELQLSCTYSIESKMNFYANFWAKRIIKDFEVKLLQVLKEKIERTNGIEQ